MAHSNARLTFHGRRLIVARHSQGWRQAHIAAAMGVSRKCVKTWIDRYTAEGEAGLHDRSSRPHTTPARTPASVEQQVIELRRAQRQGQDRLGPELGLPARTVSRILRRHHMPYLRDCDPMTGRPIRASKTTAHRYERDRPGELVHMDVKKMGRIHDGGGWKAKGRENGQTGAQKRTRIGYDYIHSLVDDHSRYAYSEILADEKGPTCAGFLLRAAQAFADVGITRIERVITDNHMSYKRSHTMRDAIATLGARHLFIKPHCPWQNGKVERYNRTLADEWAYHQPFTTNQQRAAALAPWLNSYNTDRRHSALKGLPPISRLLPT
ncbi:IS481 family transposase [Longispora albida]|uniref:IS481 family transposase n=1 Tax=Longispora albida TaxID=203523 RepID=UPI0003A3593E|nr:IS481 family transposase [Longispora albida]